MPKTLTLDDLGIDFDPEQFKVLGPVDDNPGGENEAFREAVGDLIPITAMLASAACDDHGLTTEGAAMAVLVAFGQALGQVLAARALLSTNPDLLSMSSPKAARKLGDDLGRTFALNVQSGYSVALHVAGEKADKQ
jgi:hypothetical protein